MENKRMREKKDKGRKKEGERTRERKTVREGTRVRERLRKRERTEGEETGRKENGLFRVNLPVEVCNKTVGPVRGLNRICHNTGYCMTVLLSIKFLR